ELLAFAEDGSSGAAALVSGTALILQDVYKQRYHSLPDAALVKALLLNTATDMGAKGPDFNSGFGNLDAVRAAKEMMANRFFAGALASGAQTSFRLDLPANARNLKILLAWSDPPASPNAALALVNDLDLAVTDMLNGQTLFPLTLNASPQADSLALPARNMPDHLNTQEQVVIENPATAYMINVKANTIEGSSQSFFVTYQWDTTGSLQWTYPLAPDNVFSAKKNLLRWKTTMAGNAQLAYRWIGNSEWRTISTIDLSKGYVYWQAPDTNALAQLRIITETTNFISDTIRISAPLLPMVGYDCTDSALLYWNSAKAPGYRLYALGERYMEPVQSTTDTMAFIDKRVSNKLWYSVAPLLGYGKTGVQSRAINYTTQGISCYIKKFTADLNGSNALLSIEMGSSYLLSGVQIEKRQPDGSFVSIQNVNGLLALRFYVTDPQLQQGENVYRARILLNNGQSIYSVAESVFYLAGQSYLVYPTPVQRPLPVTITAEQLANQQVNLYNATGQLVYHTIMRNLSVQLPTARFLPGLYFYSIFNAGKREAAGTIIIQ
ncbi:MAG TPA: S8 family peptidase, partial [Chitinophagaceae bacterium]|nr:S8 family peptidase [Chitinophagaceae bacterium]